MIFTTPSRVEADSRVVLDDNQKRLITLLLRDAIANGENNKTEPNINIPVISGNHLLQNAQTEMNNVFQRTPGNQKEKEHHTPSLKLDKISRIRNVRFWSMGIINRWTQMSIIIALGSVLIMFSRRPLFAKERISGTHVVVVYVVLVALCFLLG